MTGRNSKSQADTSKLKKEMMIQQKEHADLATPADLDLEHQQLQYQHFQTQDLCETNETNLYVLQETLKRKDHMLNNVKNNTKILETNNKATIDQLWT